MLIINALTQFDFYRNFSLVAGEKGMINPISNVVILEYESSLHDYSGFSEGNFVLTSLFFAKDDESLILEAFEQLISRGVSGIAVKNAYYEQLPLEVLNLANRENIPLFIFHDVYMEDIIISVSRLSEDTERSDFYEEQLFSLVVMNDHKVLCKQVLEQINPTFTSFLTALFIAPANNSSWTRVFYNQLIYKKNKLSYADRIFFTRFFTGYLFLFHYDNPCDSSVAEDFMQKTLQELGLESSDLTYSYCPICHKTERTDELLLKCCYTDIARRFQKENTMSYENIGIHKMLLPSLIRPETSLYFKEQLLLLKNYDDSKKGSLLPTLVAYVQNDMQINAAAAALFQHPNTVRYRLDKMKELLSVDNSFSFSILATYLVELYYLNKLELPYPLFDISVKNP